MANIFNVLALLSVCITAAFQWVGVEYSFYWTVWWWDIPAHFFGGLTVACWSAAVSIKLHLTPRRAAAFIFLLTLAVSVGWELWEVIEGLSGGPLDSLKDLINDMLGAAAAWAVYKVLRMW